MEDDVVIVAATRTAVGKFGGSLAKIPAAELGAKVIKSLLEKTGLKPDAVSEVIMGQVRLPAWPEPSTPGEPQGRHRTWSP
jgi:acetyl-CoA acetyltransferase